MAPELPAAYEALCAVYDNFGNNDYIGEAISQNEHAIQAGILARQKNANDVQFVWGCLFHDLGHLLGMEQGLKEMPGGIGIEKHEDIGADFLLEKLGDEYKRAAEIIRNHVNAKRYLAATTPAYAERLSEASKATLVQQGGIMTEEEVASFKADPCLNDYISMRRIDEAAKKTDMTIPTMREFVMMVLQENNML
eukprot:GFYU01000470.1.p1 GENE.GFYU01000470.1~~GFYU01000470.1.p1  ORF type:complete len:215 (-),score=55.07 GFYU01000470.1:24-605(-)